MNDADRRALRDLVARRGRALVERDGGALDRLLHAGYRYVDSLGRTLGREAYLVSRRSGEVVIVSQRAGDAEIVALGSDHALVTMTTHDVLEFKGERFEGSFAAAHVCVRAGEGWVFLFGQSTGIENEG